MQTPYYPFGQQPNLFSPQSGFNQQREMLLNQLNYDYSFLNWGIMNYQMTCLPQLERSQSWYQPVTQNPFFNTNQNLIPNSNFMRAPQNVEQGNQFSMPPPFGAWQFEEKKNWNG